MSKNNFNINLKLLGISKEDFCNGVAIKIVNWKYLENQRGFLKNKEIDELVFQENIRKYLGKMSKPNKDIEYTATNNKENFHYMNNGLTFIVDDLDQNNIAKNARLINGLQTATTLSKASNVDDVLVVVKIIIANGMSKTDIRSLIVASNSSNSITHWDLFSHEPISIEIGKKLKINDFEYIRMRVDTKTTPKKDKAVYPNDVAKILYSINSNPGQGKTGLKNMIITTHEKYKNSFGRLVVSEDNSISMVNKQYAKLIKSIQLRNNEFPKISRETIPGLDSLNFKPKHFLNHFISLYWSYNDVDKIVKTCTEIWLMLEERVKKAFTGGYTDFTMLSQSAWFGNWFAGDLVGNKKNGIYLIGKDASFEEISSKNVRKLKTN